jgi:hypothetical protein
MWVRDIVDLQWEVSRLRRWKVNFLIARAYEPLYAVLESLVAEETGGNDADTGDNDADTGDNDADTSDMDYERDDAGHAKLQMSCLAEQWVQRDPNAIEDINDILACHNLTIDAVMAQVLSENLDDVEHIERMCAMAEARRNMVLREIDRHRATLGYDLRRTISQVEDGQVKVMQENSPA